MLRRLPRRVPSSGELHNHEDEQTHHETDTPDEQGLEDVRVGDVVPQSANERADHSDERPPA